MQLFNRREDQSMHSTITGWLESWENEISKRALVIVLLVLLALLGALSAGLGWNQMPSGVVVGALGLLGIMWQTNKGFKNLIASQENRATIESVGREEQHRLDRLAEERRREAETRSLAAMLKGELIACASDVEHRCELIKWEAERLEQEHKAGGAECLPSEFPQPCDPIIWRSNADKLAYLPGALVGDIAIAVASAVQERNFSRKQKYPTEKLAEIYRGWASTLETIHHTIDLYVERLSEIETTGKPDRVSLMKQQGNHVEGSDGVIA